jgi:hypothetical protein
LDYFNRSKTEADAGIAPLSITIPNLGGRTQDAYVVFWHLNVVKQTQIVQEGASEDFNEMLTALSLKESGSSGGGNAMEGRLTAIVSPLTRVCSYTY